MLALAPQKEPDPEGMDDHSFQDPHFTSELEEVQSWDGLAKGPRLRQGGQPRTRAPGRRSECLQEERTGALELGEERASAWPQQTLETIGSRSRGERQRGQSVVTCSLMCEDTETQRG